MCSNHTTGFNARNIPPKEIASTFVVPVDFKNIASYQSLVLIGPRGIGKTTIMKVLTASGLFYLHKREDLALLLKEIDFDYVPVYIPAETVWKGNATLINTYIDDLEVKDHILNGLFVDHCLHQLINSIEDCRNVATKQQSTDSCAWAFNITKDQEKKICQLCSDFWKLSRIETSFLGLKLSLLSRSNEFRSAVNSLNIGVVQTKITSFPRLDILTLIKGFIDIFDEIIGHMKWSINFDEMEIAPKRVLSNLYQNLRSWDHRAVLKFSLFPYVDFSSADSKVSHLQTSPGEAQDYRAVVLTNKFANPNYSFAQKLVDIECKKRNVSTSEFIDYLNKSTAIKKNTRIFRKKASRNFEEIYRCALKDRTDRDFLRFIKEKGITTIKDIQDLSGNKRASKLRKTFPIAEFRSYYLTEKTTIEHGIKRRSVKGYGYYHSFEQILDLTEGNPRAINFYINDLLDDFSEGVPSSKAQNEAIARNVDRFRALVATQAVPVEVTNTGLRNTLNLVDRLASALSLELLDVKFRPEPYLSYRFKNLDPVSKQLFGLAINTGALIVEPNGEGNYLLFEVDNCRVRISHRLAPFYPLPTITGTAKRLSKVPEAADSFTNQPDLLNWMDNVDE